jgi:hypothetical protein
MDSSWNFNPSLIEGVNNQPNRAHTEQTFQVTDSYSEGPTSDKVSTYCSRLNEHNSYEVTVII